jgi:hypothetical protein
MDRGWYLLHRGWMDTDMLRRGPFCEHMAWVWLIEHASHKPKQTQYVGGHPVQVGRGELAVSLSYLAKSWGWNPSKCRRFLERLENRHALETETDTAATRIKLMNYSLYQEPKQKSDTQTKRKAASDRQTTDKYNKELKELNKPSSEEVFVLEFSENGFPLQLPDCVPQWLWDDLVDLRFERGPEFVVKDQRTTLLALLKLDRDGYDVPRVMSRCLMEGRYTFQPKPEEKKA